MADNGPTVDKSVVDVDLVNGSLNESINEEAADWTKDLTDVTNLVPTPGQFIQRPGAAAIATADDASVSTSPLWRLGALNGGLGAVGANYQLYHWNEKAQSLANKGRMPEFSVQRKLAGGTAEVSSITGVAGVAITTNYYVIAYQGEAKTSAGVTISTLIIDLTDINSGNLVRSYTVLSSALHTYVMVGVDSRYLHIYRSISGGADLPAMAVIDTNSLAASGVIAPSFTAMSVTSAGDRVAGVVAIAGASVAIATRTVASVNCRIEKFGNAGTSLLAANLAGYTQVSGIDTDGTNFYVAGRLMSATDPSSLNLTAWIRASFTASPWVGVASAGTSGTNNFTEATNPPAVGSAVNSLTPAVFNSTTSKLTGTTALGASGATLTNGTIIVLVNMNSANRTILSMGNVNPGSQLLYNSSTGFQWNQFGGSPKSIAWGTNRWAFVCVKWTGSSGKMRVGSGEWVSTSGPVSLGSGSTIQTIGLSPTGGVAMDGQMLEYLQGPTEITNDQVDDIKEYMATRYNLSL